MNIVMKEKEKTKPVTSAPQSDDAEADIPLIPGPSEDQIKTTFYLDKRSYEVFQTLFSNPRNKNVPRDVRWVDFLRAMTSLGFSVDSLNGSAWQFTPSHVDVDRSIQFHEPHPSSRLFLFQARRIGWRLSRRYGWTGETFELKRD
jgi:hypothetical protein